MEQRWSLSRTSVHNINYHLIWCTKYRRKLLVDGIDERLKEILSAKADELAIVIKAMEVMPDHVHVFVHCNPTLSAHMIVQQFKSTSARLLRQEYKSLRTRVPTLWTRSYYAESVGHLSEAVIRRYVEDQKKA